MELGAIRVLESDIRCVPTGVLFIRALELGSYGFHHFQRWVLAG